MKEYMSSETESAWNRKDIAVSVCCITYNHVKYIEKALNGFLMQKTDFNYEILIHDDASTDGTIDILKKYQRKYPDKIRLFLEEENQYSKGIKRMMGLLFPYVRGKYVAFCEGDDEWIYYGKLQEQFEWMESHPDTSMCVHNAIRYQEAQDENVLQITGRKSGYLPDDEIILKQSGEIPTASFFFREKYLEELPACYFSAPVGDEPLKFCLACVGQIYYMNRVWSLRNYMHSGAWSYNFISNYDYVEFYHISEINFLIDFAEYAKKRFTKELDYNIKIKAHLGGYYWAKRSQWGSVEELLQVVNEFKEATGHRRDSLGDEWRKEYFHLCFDYREWLLTKYFPQITRENQRLYIYGAGVEAQRCANLLNDDGIPFDGFIVTKKDDAALYLLNHTIFGVSEIDSSDSVNIWLGMNETNQEQVIPMLRELGFVNVFR